MQSQAFTGIVVGSHVIKKTTLMVISFPIWFQSIPKMDKLLKTESNFDNHLYKKIIDTIELSNGTETKSKSHTMLSENRNLSETYMTEDIFATFF